MTSSRADPENVASACVMLTVCGVTPVPATVTVVVRGLVPVLAAAVTVTVPLLLPEAGDIVAHESLLLTVQSVLAVIINDCCPPDAVKLSSVGSTVSVGIGVEVAPSCVMVTVCDATPVPLTVTVAVRWLVPVFSAATIPTVTVFK